MKEKFSEFYGNLRDIADKNKKSEAYKRHKERGDFKSSIAMMIVQSILIPLIKNSEDLSFLIGFKLTSVCLFLFIFRKHMKGLKRKRMEKGHAVFAFLHILLVSYIVFL